MSAFNATDERVIKNVRASCSVIADRLALFFCSLDGLDLGSSPLGSMICTPNPWLCLSNYNGGQLQQRSRWRVRLMKRNSPKVSLSVQSRRPALPLRRIVSHGVLFGSCRETDKSRCCSNAGTSERRIGRDVTQTRITPEPASFLTQPTHPPPLHIPDAYKPGSPPGRAFRWGYTIER